MIFEKSTGLLSLSEKITEFDLLYMLSQSRFIHISSPNNPVKNTREAQEIKNANT